MAPHGVDAAGQESATKGRECAPPALRWYPGLMANELITWQEFSAWTGTDVETLQADPFAVDVFEKTSQLAREYAEQPDWTNETAPFKVRLLVLKIAKRTYVNPDQEVSSTTGPLSSRVLDVAALAMDLSEEEQALLESYRAEGSPDGLWVASIGAGSERYDGTLYAPSLPQEGLGEVLSWDVPFLDVNDLGGE